MQATAASGNAMAYRTYIEIAPRALLHFTKAHKTEATEGRRRGEEEFMQSKHTTSGVCGSSIATVICSHNHTN